MRVSMHGGARKGSARHNDRTVQKGQKNIDFSLSSKNATWTKFDREAGHKLTTEEAQNLAYRKLYLKYYMEQMKRYRKKGNYAKVLSLEEWIKGQEKKHGREVILEIGDITDKRNGNVHTAELWKCAVEFFNWKIRRYQGNYQLVSLCLHQDEPNHGDHLHVEEIWYSHDENGNPKPGIKAALQEAGVPLPNPSEKESSKNYRMATVDAECRDKWQEICKLHGFDVISTPQERSFGNMPGSAWHEYQNALEAAKRAQNEVNGLRAALAAQAQELAAKAAKLQAGEDDLAERIQQENEREAKNTEAIRFARRTQAIQDTSQFGGNTGRNLPELGFDV